MKIILALCAIPLFALLSYLSKRISRAKLLKRLRESWGHPSDREADPESTPLYFQLKGEGEGQDDYRLDDATWDDLDCDELFALIDRTDTPIGAQRLYDLLRRPLLNCDELQKRDRMIEALRTNRDLRERIQLALQPLRASLAATLPYALWTPLPDRPAYAWVFWLLAASTLAAVPLVLLGIVNAVALIPILVADILVHVFVRRPAEIYFQSFQYLGVMVESASKVSALNAPEVQGIAEISEDDLKSARPISRRLYLMQFKDELGILEYLKIFLMTDLLSFYGAIERAKRAIAPLRRLYEALGTLDALLAVASFREEHMDFARPRFTGAGEGYRVEKAVNPLLRNAVPNSFVFEPRAALITGSNMAGKTTFLRTMGVNALLAQTLVMAFAESYAAPLQRVLSCIGRKDDLLEGKSYYMAEVEGLLKLLKASKAEGVHLFILDEIFRGTNSVEREAASLAALRYLANGRDYVLVATHDMNLSDQLDGLYANYHFQEALSGGGLTFDYMLRPGPSTTRNAIALLKHVGYPERIIEEALAHVEKDERRKA